MPAEAMLVSALIVCVFVVFGAVLYWGERRTRDAASTACPGKIHRADDAVAGHVGPAERAAG